MMCKLKGWMDKGEHYNVETKGWWIEREVDRKDGIMMCKFKVRLIREWHYDVEIKGWMQKGAI